MGIRHGVVALALGWLVFGACNARADAGSWAAIEQKLVAEYPELPVSALDHAFHYLIANESQVHNQNFMTIIDFDLPSTQKRMYVIDLRSISLTTYLVAHGKNSGENYAVRFSNVPNSNMSSLGIYLTGNPYIGKHGLSLVLRGMEPSNSNAETREIVLHGAPYVSYQSIQELGRLGRSLGCPAVNPQFSSELVQELAGGSVFFAYHSAP